MVPYHHSDTMVIFFCNQKIFFRLISFIPRKHEITKNKFLFCVGVYKKKYRMDFQYFDRVLVTGQSVCEKKILQHMRPKTFPWY